MEKVADIFDKDGDGFINYKEFVAALRPDREVRDKSRLPRACLQFSIFFLYSNGLLTHKAAKLWNVLTKNYLSAIAYCIVGNCEAFSFLIIFQQVLIFNAKKSFFFKKSSVQHLMSLVSSSGKTRDRLRTHPGWGPATGVQVYLYQTVQDPQDRRGQISSKILFINCLFSLPNIV